MKTEVKEYLKQAEKSIAAIEKDWASVDREYDAFFIKFLGIYSIAKDLNKKLKNDFFVDFEDYGLEDPENGDVGFDIMEITDEEADAVYDAWNSAVGMFYDDFQYDIEVCKELIVKVNEMVSILHKMGMDEMDRIRV